MSEKKTEVSSVAHARASQKVVGMTAYTMQTYGFTKEQIDTLNQMPEDAMKRRIISALVKENTQMIQHNEIAIPEYVLNRWEKWVKIWKQIDSSISIDLNNHKIQNWKPGYDWPIVIPKRDRVGPLRSWQQKLSLFKEGVKNKYEGINPANIRDISPYRSVFCCKPNFECKVEYPNISSEVSRDMGITGTTFTEYNILDIFVFLEIGKHIDESSLCICSSSISELNDAVFVRWLDKPKIHGWDHRFYDEDSSVRQTI
ncbi:MAG TPA: hypothetical protein VK153_02855 [Candidatus Paceibacterota bacterium]|nr:hypothetical protein [Candidatus Paceibacterota bacterium]